VPAGAVALLPTVRVAERGPNSPGAACPSRDEKPNGEPGTWAPPAAPARTDSTAPKVVAKTATRNVLRNLRVGRRAAAKIPESVTET
jgi:hypothetical protein